MDSVNAVASELGIPDDAVEISPYEVALAIEECRKDLEVMEHRRSGVKGESFEGLSIGKLAGILVFRLSRYRVVHVHIDMLGGNHDKDYITSASKLQELSALRFVSDHILKIFPHFWHSEMLYLLARRHTNQEMLGITFDVMAIYCPARETEKPLNSPPFKRFFRRPATT